MQDVLELAAPRSPDRYDGSLICGESGTGKEFIVRLIHDRSPRASGPFVSVNCAALTETLLESELFGYVRGAFTALCETRRSVRSSGERHRCSLTKSARSRPPSRRSCFERFRSVRFGELGRSALSSVNARVVAATNRDLRAAVAAGAFREDLYFASAAFVITVPPLRERREDIPSLVDDFVRRAAIRVKKDVTSCFSGGDDRSDELQLAGQCSRTRARNRTRSHRGSRDQHQGARTATGGVAKPAAHDADEHASTFRFRNGSMIERALKQFRRQQAMTPRLLKISTVTLWRKMKQYKLVS